MSEPIRFCLLVSRAGSTKIYPLPPEGMRFGYSPPLPNDLTLYDGALQDIHGAIAYDANATVGLDPKRQGTPTQFRLRAYASGIKVDDEALPAREAIAVQLWTGNRIHVGNKYVLTVAEYQVPPLGNGFAKPIDLPAENRSHALRGAEKIHPLLSRTSQTFLPYLPEIYQIEYSHSNEASSFISRFLALFESTFLPMQWTVENFELFLHPDSAPPEFLPWLAGWYGLPLDPQGLAVSQQREILRQAPSLIARQGTFAGLVELLKLYTGQHPKIGEHVGSSAFTIHFTQQLNESIAQQVRHLIDLYKPAHTSYTLTYETGT